MILTPSLKLTVEKKGIITLYPGTQSVLAVRSGYIFD